MVTIRAAAERLIAAPPDQVYAYLADYRQHHPHILPEAFSNLEVESGGVGTGTVIRFQVKVGGRTRLSVATIEEPAPGRVLVEIDREQGTRTTFTVDPEGGGSRVRIETTYQRAGLRGLVERLVAPRLLRPIYTEELDRLDRYARAQSGLSP